MFIDLPFLNRKTELNVVWNLQLQTTLSCLVHESSHNSIGSDVQIVPQYSKIIKNPWFRHI